MEPARDLGATNANVQPAAAQVASNPALRPAPAGLPNLGDGTEMAPSAERRFGDQIARSLYPNPDYLDDPVIMEYVQGIWQPLLAAARARGELPADLDDAFAWQILLFKDRSVNAFALPGAYFGLHLGLVATVTSRAELASVMAHELSHVTQRHISRRMTSQSGQTPLMLAAMILGVLAASKDPNAAQALIIGGQAGAVQAQLNFSRDMEREADRVGFGIATEAGFEPLGFVSMFDKLQQASKLSDNTNFPYLRSHPLTTERMADMQSRIPSTLSGQNTWQVVGVSTEMDHTMVSARARVLANGAVDALRAWGDEAKPEVLQRVSASQQAGILYGATLAALKLRNFPEAQVQLKRLQTHVQGDPAAARLAGLLAAELNLLTGDVTAARTALHSVAQRRKDVATAISVPREMGARYAPGAPATMASRAELFLEIQTGTQSGSPSTQALQEWLAVHPRDAQGWQLLANAYAVQGRTVSAIRAEAEGNVAQLDYPAAWARLRSAQDVIRKAPQGVDHIEASIVDTRARQVEVLAREQALER